MALFFGALLAGLALSWTPCVYPMIPILSGIIIGQKQTPSTIKAFSDVFNLCPFNVSCLWLDWATAGYFGAELIYRQSCKRRGY